MSQRTMKVKKLKSLIGLELGGHRLTAVEMRRTSGDKVEIKRKLQASLSLDPMTADPQLAAREIANLLAGAGIKGSACAVLLPLSQVLVHQIDVPELAEADVADFLNLEIERVFPFSAEDLGISISYFTDAAGGKRATLAAVTASHLAALDKVLRLAKLRPISITVGAAALVNASAKGVRAAIVRNDAGIELAIAANGGLMMLRPLSQAGAPGEREDAFDAPSLIRECRITLGRLPRPLREGMGRIRVFGSQPARTTLVRTLHVELESMGIELAPAGVDANGEIVDGDGGDNPAGLAMAVGRLIQGEAPALEFLPPRISPWRQMTKKLVGQAMLWRLGAVAGAAILFIVGAFVWQNYQINQLTAEWKAIEPAATRFTALQDKIRSYRPWYDDKIRALDIQSKLTEAFPQRGSIWLKSLQIKDMSQVIATGNARTNADVTQVIDALRKNAEVVDLQPPQMNGDNPVQFTLTYTWKAAPGNGN